MSRARLDAAPVGVGRADQSRGGGPAARAPAARSLGLSFWFCTSFGHVEQHRAGPPLARHRERLVHRLGQLLDVLDQPAVLGDRLGDADDVGLLEGVPADHRPRHLPGDGDQRRAVHVGRGDAGHQVGGAGPGRGDAHARPAAGARIAVGGVRRGLLVPHQHVPQRRVLGQRVVERHDRAARDTRTGRPPPPRAGRGRGSAAPVSCSPITRPTGRWR